MALQKLLVAACLSMCACFAGALKYDSDSERPHIVFITATNMGFNDVQWNNPEIFTPNLMAMAKAGVILNNSYVAPTGAATRTAFLTGYYGFRAGLQHSEIRTSTARTLPLNFTLLPEKLREKGYKTHLVGKWGLGFCDWKYTPTTRGFNSFFGTYSHAIDHYKHLRREWQTGYHGIDLHDNNETVKFDKNEDEKKTYTTHLFRKKAVEVIEDHDSDHPLYLYVAFHAPREPLQVPEHYSNHFHKQESTKRQEFSGMVYAVDKAVGDIKTALLKKGIFQNTVFVFTSESAANSTDGGSCWPLRGMKGSTWEGGTRVPTVISAPSVIKDDNRVSNKIFNAVDWFATLLGMAGIEPEPPRDGRPSAAAPGIDGLDLTAVLKGESEAESEREWMIYNIDEITGRRAIRKGKYKLLRGKPGDRNSWYPISKCDNAQALKADDYVGRYKEWQYIHLFDLDDDPDETQDIAEAYPHIVLELNATLNRYEELRMDGFKPELSDFRSDADPSKNGGFWVPGWCPEK